jgi:dipeptidyl aminopeptidase/acylaminoacyl peptidase
MLVALEKNGHKAESLILSGVGHNYGREKPRTEIFKRIAAFLEKNLGPGVN